MQSNILWIAAGFLLGATAAWMLVTLAFKKNRNPEETKLTAVWGFDELSRTGPPRIAASRVEGMRLPKGAKVMVPRGAIGALPASVLAECEVRMHEDVRSNFAVGEGRALMFTNHVHPKTWVVWTRDAIMVQRLASEFARLWRTAEPFVERIPLAEAASRIGSRVEVRGNILEKYEYHGKLLLRLTDGRNNLGLMTEDAGHAGLVGRDVIATGRVVKEAGHALVALERIAEVPREPGRRKVPVTA